MIDVSNQAYFSYKDLLQQVFSPIANQADLVLIDFCRKFPAEERFVISNHPEWTRDYYAHGFYRYGLFERDPATYESGLHMWDHLSHDPHRIYEYTRRTHRLAHGLTIVQQHQDFCDFFLIATTPQNLEINNFYLNRKDLLMQFIKDFYIQMADVLEELKSQTIAVPYIREERRVEKVVLTDRQKECALLLSEGYSSKEIARRLDLSFRTVEEHIHNLKTKFRARNRTHLLTRLNNYL